MTSYKLINSDIKYYNLPRTPRTPKGNLSPKFIYKWENILINDNLTQQNSKHFNCVETLINNNLPKIFKFKYLIFLVQPLHLQQQLYRPLPYRRQK